MGGLGSLSEVTFDWRPRKAKEQVMRINEGMGSAKALRLKHNFPPQVKEQCSENNKQAVETQKCTFPMVRYADICISEEIMEKYKSLQCFNEGTKLSVSQGQPGSSNCLYLTAMCVCRI